MKADTAATHVAALYNAAWWVRYYCRPHQEIERAAAIRKLGLAARAAFNATENFAPLLCAIAQAMPGV